MTDRYNTLTVVLKEDIRDDDAEYLINAIRMLKRVLSVKGNVASSSDYAAEERAKDYFRDKLVDILWPSSRDKKK